jgi:hypothetical protein
MQSSGCVVTGKEPARVHSEQILTWSISQDAAYALALYRRAISTGMIWELPHSVWNRCLLGQTETRHLDPTG